MAQRRESHAQENPVTAIDIALEPDATMVEHAHADNGRLLKAFPKGFALDATHHPHLTMLQQFVGTVDLDKVCTAADQVLVKEDVAGWNLKAFKYYYIPVPPNGIAGIVVEPTEDLLRLQQELIDSCAFHEERRDCCGVRKRRRGARHPTRIDRLCSQFHHGRSRREVQPACHHWCRYGNLP